MRIFVINPGSTSTKIGVYEGDVAIVSREFQHAKTDLARFSKVMDQREYRMAAIRTVITEENVDSTTIDAVAGRGGLLHPLEGGVYDVSNDMLTDLANAHYGEHPCNLGAVLANTLAQEWDVPAFIVDPVVTDELMDEARITGLPSIQRRSLFHALNQRGAARTAAARRRVSYESSNFIVCHMGGGISIGAHRQGRVVDVVNALDGEGPFSPERSGGLPILPVLAMIERGETTLTELQQVILREGGLFAHLGTNDPREIIKRIQAGDEQAKIVFNAFAYAIAKHMASMAPALTHGTDGVNITALVLTGGLARSVELVHKISQMLMYLGPVEVIIGDEEMGALAAGPIRVLQGQERAKLYVASPENR